MKNKRLLIFHPTIAPYRIDFFNDLYESFQTRICLQYRNLKSQQFDYDKIRRQFIFNPFYLPDGSKMSLLRAVQNQIKSFNPDVVLTCEFNFITIVALLQRFMTGKRYKVVVMCDDSYDMVSCRNDFSARHRIARNCLSHFIDDVIVVNPDVQRWFLKKYKKGIYFPIIKNDERARLVYRKSLHLRLPVLKINRLEGKNIFLFVGRLVSIKNVDSIIKAFAFLDQNNNALVIVGSGPEEHNLKTEAEKNNLNVIFTGRLEGDRLNVWYTIADFFVLASSQEPFGAVTNEALLAGCRCLISRKAGSCCLIEDGVNGYVFDPDSIEDLVLGMKRAVQMPKLHENNGLRPNQMTVSYNDYIQRLITEISKL